MTDAPVTHAELDARLEHWRAEERKHQAAKRDEMRDDVDILGQSWMDQVRAQVSQLNLSNQDLRIICDTAAHLMTSGTYTTPDRAVTDAAKVLALAKRHQQRPLSKADTIILEAMEGAA